MERETSINATVSETEIKYLRHSLEQANREKHEVTIQMSKEKEELTRQYMKDKNELMEILSRMKEVFAQKELEFAKKLATQQKPIHNHSHNHYYHQYAINMTPWCIDPHHDSYEKFLEIDIKVMKEAMSILPPRPSIPDKTSDTMDRQRIFTNVVRKQLNAEYPCYVVVDTARSKGMFVMPDKTVRMDPGMSMMMNHQVAIGMRLAKTACDWWFLTPMKMKTFRNMVTCAGGNGAFRLRQITSG